MSSLLVNVWKIQDIRPIAKANKVEIAVVGGWNTVVQKGTFKIGDKVVYFQPEICIPTDISDSLGVTKYLAKGGRIRSTKLAGEISHGFIIKADPAWPVGLNVADKFKASKDSRDAEVEEEARPEFNLKKSFVPRSLRVWWGKFADTTRYEAPKCNVIRPFRKPEHLRNFPEVLNSQAEIAVHEKLHGSFSMCQFNRDSTYACCSSGRTLQIPYIFKPKFETSAKFLTVLQMKLGLGEWEVDLTKKGNDRFYRVYFDTKVAAARFFEENPTINTIHFCGEVVGPKIQKLTYGHQNPAWYCFGVYFDGKFVDKIPETTKFKKVPLVYNGPMISYESLKSMAEGNTDLCDNQIKEGVVITVKDQDGSRQMYKLVSDQYLLWNSHD